MARFKEVLRDVHQAVRRGDIKWLVTRLFEVIEEINERSFVRMVILSEIENKRMWQQHPRFSGASWQYFLRQVWPGMTDYKFQNSKRLLEKFGGDVFRKYGYERLVAVARFGGFEDEILEAIDVYCSKKGNIPSTTTVASIGMKISGNKHAVARFSSPVFISKSETSKLRKENARLRKENAHLIKENCILREKLKRLFGQELKDI